MTNATGWDTVESSNAGGFLRLQEGENKFRIVKGPVMRLTHFSKQDKKSYPCMGTNCLHCTGDERPKRSWLFHVIDRKDGQLKLADLGVMVTTQIKEYRSDPEYTWAGETMERDVKVVRRGTGMETEYVTMLSPTVVPLTPEEAAQVAALPNLDDVKAKLEGI